MGKPVVAVVDYGMGNLRSMGKALELVGAEAVVTDDPARIVAAHAVVFPGVGSFGPAMKNLSSRGVREALMESIGAEKPFLGVCLGFQLLFSYGEEDGRHDGLGVIPGGVVRFRPGESGLKVPHMGWNTVAASPAAQGTMFKGLSEASYFYFVHSYYCVPDDDGTVAGTTVYGSPFCSAVARGRTWGCQFHPEKSSAAGLQVLKNFLEEVNR